MVDELETPRFPPWALMIDEMPAVHEKIAYPFVLHLSHRPLDLRTMVGLSGSFDEYDGFARARLVVDVMESLPAKTVLHIKPLQPMTFDDIAQEVDLMVCRSAADLAIDDLRVTKISWTVRNMGIPVHERAGFGVIA